MSSLKWPTVELCPIWINALSRIAMRGRYMDKIREEYGRLNIRNILVKKVKVN